MKHYLAELHILPYINSKDLHKKESVRKIILCEDGEYRLIKKQLYKHKFYNEIPDSTTHKYIDHYTLQSSENKLIQCEQTFRIPYEHILFAITRIEYTLHPQSQTLFVIEKIDKKMTDFYFESPHDSMHQSLKEDIISLLSYLK